MHLEQENCDSIFFEDNFERAGRGQRLANYLIDLFIYYLLAFAFGVCLAILVPDFAETFANNGSNNSLGDTFFSLVFYGLYMSVVEAVFKGKSLGKLITKTRAVNLDNTPISIHTAFARGFSRALPFCVFSAFGSPCNPWQDRWNDTMVIKEKQF